MPASQHLLIHTAVALRRSHEADAAVAVFMVVPAHEVPDPGPGCIQIGKTVLRPLRAVFEGSEQRLRVRIVIAHPWAAT
ncbi:hypothetical protein D3C80_2111550 [compost metagenome]